MAKMRFALGVATPLVSLTAAFLAFAGLGFQAAIGATVAAILSIVFALSLRQTLVAGRASSGASLTRLDQEVHTLKQTLGTIRAALEDLTTRLPPGPEWEAFKRALGEVAQGHIPSTGLEEGLDRLGRSEAAEKAARAFEEARLILPLARKVVAAVPGKTEEATMALIERFEEARSLSAKAASTSSEAIAHLEGGKGTESFQTAARKAKEAIIAERDAVSSIVGNNRENAKKLQVMSKELQSGIELINGIEEITERSRLIAFNMAVEAARIGEKGRGFRVIVNELRSLNDRTVEFSRRVAELLGRYRDYSATLVSGMAEHSERLSGEVMEVMNSSQAAVESLLDSASTTEGLSSHLAGLVVELDHNLDGVLEALQFQDVTRQMLEGGIRLVEDSEERMAVAAALLEPLGPRDSQASKRRFDELTRGFVARATTLDEKRAIQEAHQ